jgi:hypothetical protein
LIWLPASGPECSSLTPDQGGEEQHKPYSRSSWKVKSQSKVDVEDRTKLYKISKQIICTTADHSEYGQKIKDLIIEKYERSPTIKITDLMTEVFQEVKNDRESYPTRVNTTKLLSTVRLLGFESSGEISFVFFNSKSPLLM